MNTAAVIAECFDRVASVAQDVLDDIDPTLLTKRVDPQSNTIAWLIWHLTRVQDDHVAEIAGTEQVWLRDGWCDRFDLPFPASTIGYGADADEVAAVVASAELLRGYLEATRAATLEFVRGLSDADLDHIVDERWDPPVTLGVRLVSVISDDLQHGGQAAFLRGVLQRDT